MDENKLKQLKHIKYNIASCCGNCKYGKFSSSNTNFGTCDNYTYYHLKHKTIRYLSINRFGKCTTHELKQLDITDQEFFKYFGKV